VLGYQNIGQLYKQHGRDGAQAILGSIGTMVFLPGLDAETAQYAAKRIGRTTVLQHTVADATGNMFDHERLAETGRDLLDAAELRQMAEHTQAVAIIATAPPVKFGFPEYAKGGRLAHPLPRELTNPIPLAEAEAEAALTMSRREETTIDEAVTNEVPPELDPAGDRLVADEYVIPRDQSLFPLFEEWELTRSHPTTSAPAKPVGHDPILKRIREKIRP
jgi:type IV secretory pathway TraG/TraD family ATPase VirD4